MIGAFVCGGLGNQMFQYAAGRALAMRHRTSLRLDLASFGPRRDFEVLRPFELEKLKIDVEPNTALSPLSFLLARRPHSPLNAVSGWTTFREQSLGRYDPKFGKLADNTYIYGYWQSWRYFSSAEEQIRREFQPRLPLSNESQRVRDKMRSANSISIHVRRGDYLTTRGASDFHGVLDIQYYSRALAYAQERAANLVGFVFSDDLEWCRKEFTRFSLPLSFVDSNYGKDSWQDIFLMAASHHKIIANSSFSWWGAALSEGPETDGRIVIAPERCFTGDVNLPDRYPSDWTIL